MTKENKGVPRNEGMRKNITSLFDLAKQYVCLDMKIYQMTKEKEELESLICRAEVEKGLNLLDSGITFYVEQEGSNGRHVELRADGDGVVWRTRNTKDIQEALRECD